jgi:3-phenylpropionate/trans-cinnamate dioxygenase ferredoxin reductase component
LIENAAPFPPTLPVADQSSPRSPVPAAFPDPRVPT